MKNIHITARFHIHKNKTEAFKSIANKCIASVRSNKKGALQYDWFFSPDNLKCVVQETYVYSEAVMVHMANVGELLGQLLEISDFSGEIFGNPSGEIIDAATALNPKYYSYFNGL